MLQHNLPHWKRGLQGELAALYQGATKAVHNKLSRNVSCLLVCSSRLRVQESDQQYCPMACPNGHLPISFYHNVQQLPLPCIPGALTNACLLQLALLPALCLPAAAGKQQELDELWEREVQGIRALAAHLLQLETARLDEERARLDQERAKLDHLLASW